MRNSAAGNIVDDVLKSIWMQRLPTSIQQILSVSKDSLDGLAQIADKVNEVSSFRPEVNAVVSENSELQSLREEVANLRLTLISNQSPYHPILSKFPELLTPVLGNVGASHNVEHCIETRGPPVFSKARRLNPEKLKFLREEFQTLMEQGIIRPSNSAYAAHVLFVKKQNGDWRICGDFRRLNSITISDRYPLPHIHDFSHGLAGNVKSI
ncbi:hypothetical protein AVEN_256973-2 [Araneus ventricosus]|uniref:Transposon Ty3-I Gag-Pol polyprotein n=1 Tax=Araneus ventricosus TaxID=182803 RepID=A0A4Y2EFK5_ARAVE|nr:hypothetical protein AVEN_256973-2 [Araneus ventricosus]